MTKTLRTCDKGHQYFKSSDCPVCPVCEQQRRSDTGFLAVISAPARRALENKGISTVEELAAFSERELLQLHGFGPGSLPKLRHELQKSNLRFREK